MYTAFLFFCIGQQLTAGFSKAQKEFTKKLTFQPGGEINIKTDDGDVTIIGWEKNEVLIEAKLTAHAFSSRAASKKVEQIRIHVRESENFIRISHNGPDNTDVAYTIHVPEKISISCRTDDGTVHIENIYGKIGAESDDGDIFLKRITGDVRLRSDDGEIFFTGKFQDVDVLTEDGDITGEYHPQGNSYIKTDDGNVQLTLHLDETEEPAVFIDTDDGHVQSDFPLWMENQKMRRSASEIKIKVYTNDGDVRLIRE
ncbi:MAG: DUF4097 family beta strand repeat protein [Deferribacteres bacterium]|nr:DUF4097 family beta strand repeat protein [Deferribacteres bacterium]